MSTWVYKYMFESLLSILWPVYLEGQLLSRRFLELIFGTSPEIILGFLSYGHFLSFECDFLEIASRCIGEGDGNPLQCSCLENPRDGGAWWAAIYGVAQSRTQLMRLGGGGLDVARQDPLFMGFPRQEYWRN